MPVVHYTVTVAAAAADLKTLAGLADNQERPIQSLSIQADPANTGIVYVGGPGVTSADWLVYIPVPAANIPTAPLIFESATGRPMHLGEFFVVGTAGDKLHIGGVGW